MMNRFDKAKQFLNQSQIIENSRPVKYHKRGDFRWNVVLTIIGIFVSATLGYIANKLANQSIALTKQIDANNHDIDELKKISKDVKIQVDTLTSMSRNIAIQLSVQERQNAGIAGILRTSNAINSRSEEQREGEKLAYATALRKQCEVLSAYAGDMFTSINYTEAVIFCNRIQNDIKNIREHQLVKADAELRAAWLYADTALSARINNLERLRFYEYTGADTLEYERTYVASYKQFEYSIFRTFLDNLLIAIELTNKHMVNKFGVSQFQRPYDLQINNTSPFEER